MSTTSLKANLFGMLNWIIFNWKALWSNIYKVVIKLNYPICFIKLHIHTIQSKPIDWVISVQGSSGLRDFIGPLFVVASHPPVTKKFRPFIFSFCLQTAPRKFYSTTFFLRSCWLLLSFNVVSSKVLLYKTVLWSMLLGTRGQSTIMGALLSGNHLVVGGRSSTSQWASSFQATLLFSATTWAKCRWASRVTLAVEWGGRLG